MTKLKTLKDFVNKENWVDGDACPDCLVTERLRQEAIKWIKHFMEQGDCKLISINRKKEAITFRPMNEQAMICSVFIDFFNISEEEMKK